MMFPTRPINSDDYVLVVLGHHGHPTFKTISTDQEYLKALGEELVSLKRSQFLTHEVVSSSNVFTLTNPDYSFDQAMEQMVRDLILSKSRVRM